MAKPLEIAAVHAQADDGELFAAGTLTKWTRQGHEIHANRHRPPLVRSLDL